MYAAGIPTGMVIDAKGHKPGLIVGFLAMGIGYYPMKIAYDNGPGSMSVAALCFFSGLTGIGSCCAFQAAIKVSAQNFPNHRGTATGFPLAAFGLSAFLFSLVGSLVFPGDTSGFILLLAVGTPTLVIICYFFLRVVPHSGLYSAIPGTERRGSVVINPASESNKDEDARGVGQSLAYESEEEAYSSTYHLRHHHESDIGSTSIPKTAAATPSSDEEDDFLSEASSLVSKPPRQLTIDTQLDIKGLKLIVYPGFWELWILLSLLAGTGLMTINNIGLDTHALWRAWDPEMDPTYIEKQQASLVSLLSLLSCFGRLASGVSSDIVVRKTGLSRLWMVVMAGIIFWIAQISALSIDNPHLLYLVATLSGLGYGLAFGVFPTMTAESFGMNGLSQNWGTMTLAPAISGNVFNVFYGVVMDSHAELADPEDPDSAECVLGKGCYKNAYYITFCSSLAAIFLALFSIWRRSRESRLKLATPA
jgi:MFS family permease